MPAHVRVPGHSICSRQGKEIGSAVCFQETDKKHIKKKPNFWRKRTALKSTAEDSRGAGNFCNPAELGMGA